jgi:hypothetical protein
MPNNGTTTFTIPPDIREMLGPAPVLSAAEAEAYEQMILPRFAQAVRPQDWIEWFSVKDLADARLEMSRWRILKNRLMEEGSKAKVARETAGIQARLVSETWGVCVTSRSVFSPAGIDEKAEAGEDKKVEAGESAERGEKADPTNKVEADSGLVEPDKSLEAERELKLKAEVAKLIEENAKKLALQANSLSGDDHAGSFQDWITAYERADRLQTQAERRFNDALELLDRHRAGLGLRLRQASDDIVDGEYKELATQPDQVSAVARVVEKGTASEVAADPISGAAPVTQVSTASPIPAMQEGASAVQVSPRLVPTAYRIPLRSGELDWRAHVIRKEGCR